MQRRDFLKRMLMAPAAVGLATIPSVVGAVATRVADKTLVVIFQRGGCDGLNAVVPHGDDEYYNLRPTIAVPRPGSSAPNPALDLNGFFGLHPSLAPLYPLYQSGAVAVLPAVHYPAASRSHFDSQQYIESGTPDRVLDGWLNRYLVARPADVILQAGGFGHGLQHALKGDALVATIDGLDGFGFGAGRPFESQLQSYLQAIYAQDTTGDAANRSLVHAAGGVLLRNMRQIGAIDFDNYEPANGADYPDGGYGENLQQIAQLIKMGVGLEIAAVDIGGWDTHSGQGGSDPAGSQARRFQEFAAGIAALYADLGSAMNDVVIMTMTEFGRTARENGSRGTDHGNASSWFVLGNAVQGGIYGDWPGLGPAELYRGRYLDFSIDFRDVFAEVVSGHLGSQDVAGIIPDHLYSPIGFLS